MKKLPFLLSVAILLAGCTSARRLPTKEELVQAHKDQEQRLLKGELGDNVDESLWRGPMYGSEPIQEHPDGRISWRGYKGCVEALNRGYVPTYGGEKGVDACLAVQRIEVANEQARKDRGSEASRRFQNYARQLEGRPSLEQEEEMIRRGINPFPPPQQKVIIQQDSVSKLLQLDSGNCRGQIIPPIVSGFPATIRMKCD